MLNSYPKPDVLLYSKYVQDIDDLGRSSPARRKISSSGSLGATLGQSMNLIDEAHFSLLIELCLSLRQRDENKNLFDPRMCFCKRFCRSHGRLKSNQMWLHSLGVATEVLRHRLHTADNRMACCIPGIESKIFITTKSKRLLSISS